MCVDYIPAVVLRFVSRWLPVLFWKVFTSCFVLHYTPPLLFPPPVIDLWLVSPLTHLSLCDPFNLSCLPYFTVCSVSYLLFPGFQACFGLLGLLPRLFGFVCLFAILGFDPYFPNIPLIFFLFFKKTLLLWWHVLLGPNQFVLKVPGTDHDTN